MSFILFSKLVFLEKVSMKVGFGNFVSPSCFEIVTRTHARLLDSFLTQIFLQLVVLEKKHMKQTLERIVNEVVNHMTRGRCIPTDSTKSGDGNNNGVGE